MNKDTSEIAKLTERISKDPKSKLFVPLAEEYKKVGDIEMAIHVLSEGLKHNPGYASAKSFLGRLLLEKGELRGALKEFEEVVTTIPDNLFAQRKLGDIYALQNNRSEALKHYKIVLSLNPGDKEVASLVSKFEAGSESGPNLQQQTKPSPEPEQYIEIKPVSQREEQTTPPEPPEMPPTPEKAAPMTESKSEPEPLFRRVESESEQAGTVAEAEPARPEMVSEPSGFDRGLTQQSDQHESEVPEEVLVVEPLEDDYPLEATSSPGGLDFFAVKTEERADEISAVHEPRLEQPDTVEKAEPEPLLPVDSEPSHVEETPVSSESKPADEQSVDQSDDFTTDTLAELYIAQGFFEKAIDIYQRMLADRPNSRGLRDKLERVKAMAVASEASVPMEYPMEEGGKESFETGVFAELKEFLTSVEAEDREESVTKASEEKAEVSVGAEPKEDILPEERAKREDEEPPRETELLVEPEEIESEARTHAVKENEDIFAESREYRMAAETEPENEPTVVVEETNGDENSYDIFTTPAPESARVKPLHTDFEPQEYIPPDATPREEKKENVRASPKQPDSSRKETIDRLENWLKNIVKEK